MHQDNTVKLLRRTRLFEHLDQMTLERLAQRAVERKYRKGEMIFHQQDPGESLYIVVEGVIKVFVTSAEGDEMVLVTLRPPDTLGELALLDGGMRSASAQALERTTVVSLSRAKLLDLLPEHPNLAEVLLGSLSLVVRRLTEQFADLVFLDLHGRVAKLVVDLANQRGHREGAATILDLDMTQSDLAAMVGGSRQSVNQILKSFERHGYLELHGRRVVIKRPDLLERRAGS